jgi:uncharacterized RDD family membrane protein YckC
MTFDDTRTVTTPEQVAVTYTLAGMGTRFVATLLDTCIQVLVALIVGLIAAAFGAAISFSSLGPLDTMVPSWLFALTIMVIFGVIWGYFIFWEAVWNGQTPGKRVTGIRVMRDGGYPVDFRAAFVRNVMRYVDFLPMFYGAGALAVFLSKDSKRLGDYAAGTIVVMDARPAPFVQSTVTAPPTEYRLLGDPALLNLRAVTREQFAVVDRFLSRRLDLAPNVRAEMAYKIAWPLMAVIGLELPTDASYAYEAFLVELAAAYRVRAGG